MMVTTGRTQARHNFASFRPLHFVIKYFITKQNKKSTNWWIFYLIILFISTTLSTHPLYQSFPMETHRDQNARKMLLLYKLDVSNQES